MVHVATRTRIATVTPNAIAIRCEIADLDKLVRAQRDPGVQEARRGRDEERLGFSFEVCTFGMAYKLSP